MTSENRSGSAIEFDRSSVILNAFSAVKLQDLVINCVQQVLVHHGLPLTGSKATPSEKNTPHQDEVTDDGNTNNAPNINTSSFKRGQLTGSDEA